MYAAAVHPDDDGSDWRRIDAGPDGSLLWRSQRQVEAVLCSSTCVAVCAMCLA